MSNRFQGSLFQYFCLPLECPIYLYWTFAVSENKALCHPSSVDSLSTSAATEDHVSMGGWAARKALKVIEHVEQGMDRTAGCRQWVVMSLIQGADHRKRTWAPVHGNRGMYLCHVTRAIVCRFSITRDCSCAAELFKKTSLICSLPRFQNRDFLSAFNIISI